MKPFYDDDHCICSYPLVFFMDKKCVKCGKKRQDTKLGKESYVIPSDVCEQLIEGLEASLNPSVVFNDDIEAMQQEAYTKTKKSVLHVLDILKDIVGDQRQ